MFIHLKNYTEYSIEKGMLKLNQLVDLAVNQGMHSLAITDLNNLFASIKFYQNCIKRGIKPIIGADLSINNFNTRITFLAQNNVGYKNLIHLVSEVSIKKYLTTDDLIKYNENLIALCGYDSHLASFALENETELIKQSQKFQQIFDCNRFYFTISKLGKENEDIVNYYFLKTASNLKIPAIAVNDVCFATENDFEAHEIKTCITTGKTLNNTNRKILHSREQYFKTELQLKQLFNNNLQLISNSEYLAKRCNVTLEIGKTNYLPKIDMPIDIDEESYFIEQVKQKLVKKIENNNIKQIDTQKYKARLEFEYRTIIKMGYISYFLIVTEFIQWAKDNGIPVGPGRGSGAGSLVAYVLGITDVDPLKFDLFFERFLNPERISMPDFDIDFCIDGRDKVIEHVAKKYGKKSVTQIITFGTMAAKAVVRDVTRVMNYPYAVGDKLAKLIPNELGITLLEAYQKEKDLQEYIKNDVTANEVFEMSQKLEGLVRNVGTHAGGVVIAPSNMTNFTAIYQDEDGNYLTQFDKDDLEKIGLVKFDFLGLRTLTIINNTIKLIKENKPEFELEKQISYQDKQTFELLSSGETTAIFQLESDGLRQIIKKLKPDSLEDIVALVALYRPGPLGSGMVDSFINVKHGKKQAVYQHPKLESILKKTYGVVLYQEQVMQIAQKLANYSPGEADLLRRAMGKKKVAEMAKEQERFCSRAVKNGIEEKIAKEIFDIMNKFAGYGFNKSHSVAYAIISYQTAWLKKHFPTEFLTANLNSALNDSNKLFLLIDEAKKLRIKILNPDVNKSDFIFKKSKNNIIYGLGGIKGVSYGIALAIMKVRDNNGFKDILDLITRIKREEYNKKSLSGLILTGCFDNCTNKFSRKQMFENLHKIIDIAKNFKKNEDSQGLFEISQERQKTNNLTDFIEPKGDEWQELDKSSKELEVLGFYLTSNPITLLKDELSHIKINKLSELNKIENSEILFVGTFVKINKKFNSKGKVFYRTIFADDTSKLEITIFNSMEFTDKLKPNQIFFIKGVAKYDNFNNSNNIKVNNIYSLDEFRMLKNKNITLQLYDQINYHNLIKYLKKNKSNDNIGIDLKIKLDNQFGSANMRLAETYKLDPKQTYLFKDLTKFGMIIHENQ